MYNINDVKERKLNQLEINRWKTFMINFGVSMANEFNIDVTVKLNRVMRPVQATCYHMDVLGECVHRKIGGK